MQVFSQNSSSSGVSDNCEIVQHFPHTCLELMNTDIFSIVVAWSSETQIPGGGDYLCGSNALRKLASIERVGTLRFQLSLIKIMWIHIFQSTWGF